jgi:hypothetical protein
LKPMSQSLRMVHLRTVPDSWHAKVLVARLGSEGILTHLQGSVAGPYPFGAVSVLVEADQADLAAALLLADEVESAFAGHGPGALPSPGGEADAGADDVFGYPTDDFDEDSATRRWRASRRRRALAAAAALLVAGAPLLAHLIGQ